MIIKMYQWTQNGLVLAGRILNGSTLEAYRPDGLLTELPPVLFSLKGDVNIELEPITPFLPSIFTFQRPNGTGHVISIKDGKATIDGSLLELDELALLVQLAETGQATIKYQSSDAPLTKTETPEKYQDPITGAESLPSLVATQPPYLYCGIWDYKDRWEQSPKEAQELCKIVVDHLLKVGSCIRLIGGSFVCEVEDEQQGLEVAVKIIHELNETVAGKSGLLKVGLEILDRPMEKWTPKNVGLTLPDGRIVR